MGLPAIRGRAITLLLACALAGLATAPSAGAAATRAEYAAQANAICAGYEDQQRELLRKLGRAPKFDASAEAQRRYLKRLTKSAGKLQKLDAMTAADLSTIPPAPGDETLAAEWLASLRRAIDLVKPAVRLSRLVYRLGIDYRTAYEGSEEGDSTTKEDRILKRLRRASGRLSRAFARVEEAVLRSDALANQIGAIECVGGGEDQGTTAARASLLD